MPKFTTSSIGIILVHNTNSLTIKVKIQSSHSIRGRQRPLKRETYSIIHTY
ncbi:unnamed protein product, partial [Nesidiocoris tenuis]